MHTSIHAEDTKLLFNIYTKLYTNTIYEVFVHYSNHLRIFWIINSKVFHIHTYLYLYDSLLESFFLLDKISCKFIFRKTIYIIYIYRVWQQQRIDVYKLFIY